MQIWNETQHFNSILSRLGLFIMTEYILSYSVAMDLLLGVGHPYRSIAVGNIYY